MKTIYLVTSGEYSDYGVNAVFDNKELAEKFIASFEPGHWGRMRIEEMELNPYKSDIKAGRKAFEVRMDINGNVKKVEIAKTGDGFNYKIHLLLDDLLLNYCFAKDEKHAIKITNERRAQYIANNT